MYFEEEFCQENQRIYNVKVKMDDVSEYEKIQQRNIEERRALMKKHLEEMGILKIQIISGHLNHPAPASKKLKLRKFISYLQSPLNLNGVV